MPPDALPFIAFVAIVGVVVRSIVRTVTDAGVRKIEARASMQAQSGQASTSEMQALREEIARLRETTTQHALSLQNSVERLDQRVEFMERKSIAAGDAVSIEPAPLPQQQIVGRS